MAIIQGKTQTITLTLRVGGAPVSIESSAEVTAQLFAADGSTPISSVVAVSPNALGAQWANGVVVVELSAQDTANVAPPSVVFLITARYSGATKTWTARLDSGEADVSSALISYHSAVSKLRAALLHGVAGKLDIDQSLMLDEELWELWLASEVEAGRKLGFPLQPTEIFTDEPTDAEIAALNGAPYLVEPGYDMPPDFFGAQSWGSIALRVCPVIAVKQVRLVYPSMQNNLFEVPLSWVKVDKKYGQIHIIPGPNLNTAPLSIFMVQSLAAGVQIPHIIRIRYRAGIDGKSPEFVDLRDLVKQMALLRVMQGAFVPQSGSISADGLSQSASLDLDKFQESIDQRLSKIREKVLGPVWGVL